MTTGPTGRPDATPGATVAASAPGVARVLLATSVYCAACDDWTAVSLQVPPSTPLQQLADDLDALVFEARVSHEIERHAEELAS